MPFLPKKKMPWVYSTKQALEALGISAHTFIRYRKLLGIEPRRMVGVRGSFYLYDELAQIIDMRAPKRSVFRKHVLERYEAMRKAREDGQ